MDEKLWKLAEKLAARNYSVVVSEDKLANSQIIYMAKNPELFGCMAQGSTLEEAIKNLEDARVDYIYDSLAAGAEIPDPKSIAVQTRDTAYVLDQDQFVIETTVTFKKAVETVAQPGDSTQLYEAWLTT